MLIVNLSVFSAGLSALLSEQPARQTQESAKTAVDQKTRCNFSTVKSVTLDSDTIENAAVKKVEPIYPQTARQQGIQGLVIVKVLINSGGNVERACALNGDELVRSAAEAAALEWKFGDSRVLLQSKKADFLLSTIPFYFVLNKKETHETLAKKLRGFGKIDFTKAEYGSLSEIRDKHRVFIYTENPIARDRIYILLQQYDNLATVDEPEQADFFVTFAKWQIGVVGSVPAPFNPAMVNSPITSEDLLAFTVNEEQKSDRLRPRILLWGGRRATKVLSTVEFKQTPPFIILTAFHKALAEVLAGR